MKLIKTQRHNTPRVAVAATLLCCACSPWSVCREAAGQMMLSSGGLTLLEESGSFAPGQQSIGEIEINGAEFRNLDFEQAVITLEPPDQDPNGFTMVLVADALPYWTTNGAGGNPAIIGYNSVCLGAGCTSIHDIGSMFSLPPLEGEYTPILQGPKLSPPDEGSLYLAQVGLVPADATRLTLLANQVGNDSFFLTFDDGGGPQVLTQLTPFPLSQTVRLVFDISPFTGQIGELKINSDAVFESFAYVDDLRFIPEPSAGLLLALVGVAAVVSRSLHFGSR